MFFHYVARGHGADQIHQENHHHHHDADSLPLYGAVEAAGQCIDTHHCGQIKSLCVQEISDVRVLRALVFPSSLGR